MVVESGVLIRDVRSYKSCWRLLLYCPVPVSATDCEWLAALLRTVMVAERAPARFGQKVTEIVQLPPAANPVPPIGQLFVLRKPRRIGTAKCDAVKHQYCRNKWKWMKCVSTPL